MNDINYIDKIKAVWTTDSMGTPTALDSLLAQYKDQYEQLYFKLVCGVPV